MRGEHGFLHTRPCRPSFLFLVAALAALLFVATARGFHAGAYWETLREHRADIEAAYREREKAPQVFNGAAARERAQEMSKLQPVPKFMRNKPRANNGKTAKSGGKAASERRKKDRSDDDKKVRADMKTAGGGNKEQRRQGSN